MMIMPLFSMTLKNYLFFNSLFCSLDTKFVVFMSLSLLIYCSLNLFKFNVFNLFEYFWFKISIFMIFFFMILSFFCENILFFLFFYEFSLYYIILIILNFSNSEDKISSSLFMLIMNVFGSLSYIIVFSNFVPYYNTLMMNTSMNLFMILNNMYMIIFISIIFIFKIPLFLLHFWLLKAHVSASGIVSIILASLMLKLGYMGILKFNFTFIYFMDMMISILISISMISFVFLCLFMLRCIDLKIMVASSSVVHMVYLPFLLLSFSNMGYISSFIMVVSHGIISFMMFFIVTLIYEQFSNRSIFFLKGFSMSFLFMFFMFFIYICLNFGFPPFMSFISEFFLGYMIYMNTFVLFFSFFFMTMLCGLSFMLIMSKISLGKVNYLMYMEFNISFYFISFYLFYFFFIYLFIFNF